MCGWENFKIWLQRPNGARKGEYQVGQLLWKVLKYLKHWCGDVSASWDIPENVPEYSLGCLAMIFKFVGC